MPWDDETRGPLRRRRRRCSRSPGSRCLRRGTPRSLHDDRPHRRRRRTGGDRRRVRLGQVDHGRRHPRPAARLGPDHRRHHPLRRRGPRDADERGCAPARPHSAWCRRTRGQPQPCHLGEQVAEALRATAWPTRPAVRRGVELLGEAGIPDPRGAPPVPARVLRRHAAAGADRDRPGLRARAADRRRAHLALDATVQRQILDHLESLRAARGTSLMLITHDLASPSTAPTGWS